MISNRQLSALLLVVLSSVVLPGGVAQGQNAQRAPCGFIRLLNAVSIGTGKLEFFIDGKSVRPDGYQLGNITGGIALKPDTYKVEFRRDGVKDGETRVIVAANDTTILIPFAEQLPVCEGQPVRWEIRILRLKQHAAENQRTATFVSVSRDPELKVEIRQSDGKWHPVLVKRLGIARADIRQARGYMSVRCKQQELSAVSVGAAGKDENGILRSKTFQDYKYLSTD
ncbi:MAG: hypothetical protein NTV46_07115 [Verrucomicrobia bacterium]|nr:hypothetical protein [Verrucomicrobiota bacterium]